MTTSEQGTFSKGLQDIVAAESSLCQIDGKNSKLAYRGYNIHDLAQNSNFEETAFLLLFGSMPTEIELGEFSRKLAAERALPAELVSFIQKFPKNANPMAALRSAVSLLSFYDNEAEDKTSESNVRKSIRLMARVPSLVAYFERSRKGLVPVEPKLDASYTTAANFLYMLKGRDATPVEIKMLDKYFILLTEHDLNASTFACRITASTTSDIYSSITSAIGTLKGDLHGSANSRAMESILAIAEVSKVEAYVDNAITQKKKLMGFGHRIYKGPDPRAFDLKIMAKSLADANPEQSKWYAISEKLEQTVRDRKGLNTNVDFYSASVLYIIGISVDLFTAMFAISRMAGWTAHYLEQISDNRLIRPVSHYTGAVDQVYVPIQKRK